MATRTYWRVEVVMYEYHETYEGDTPLGYGEVEEAHMEIESPVFQLFENKEQAVGATIAATITLGGEL